MTQDAPRAVVVLVQRGRELRLGPVVTPARGDLALVDDLLRLHHAAARFGWRVRVTDVCPYLQELLELAGVAEELELRYDSRNAGTPNSANNSG